jgi:GINS complex subunit 3
VVGFDSATEVSSHTHTYIAYNFSQPSESIDSFTISKPSCLETPVRNDLKAEPRKVDLRGLCPHFFSFGAMNLELWGDDDELCDVLVESFKKRAREIGDQAPNTSGHISSEVADFKGRLDEQERQRE